MKDNRTKKTSDQIKRISESVNLPTTNCAALGTCEILKAHHEVLKDDRDRLKTDFLINLICGEEKMNKYKSKKDAHDY